MKTASFFAVVLLCHTYTTGLLCQAPGRIWYQTVVTNPSGVALANRTAGLKLSVLQGSSSGSMVYAEAFSASTDSEGLLSVELGGGGTPLLGSFDTVDWSAGPYFLGIEIDIAGGTDYISAGVAQLLSMPSALHAGRGGEIEVSVSATGDTVYIGSGYIIAPGASAANEQPSVPPEPVYAEGYVHCFGGSDTTVVVDVTNPLTGHTWMDRNLGASQVATAFDDAASYGDLFQWGRFPDGHQCARAPNMSATTNNQATTAVGTNTDDWWYGKYITTTFSPFDWLATQDETLWQGESGVNNPCPAGYRLPTIAEWETERYSWNEFNSAGAMSSPLKLPAAGARFRSDGTVRYVGSYGYFWSSSVSSSFSQRLYFNSTTSELGNNDRAFGFSIRCFKG